VISVLIEATHAAKEDGTLLDGSATPVLVVPAAALEALLLKDGRAFGSFESRFGRVSDERKADLLAAFQLLELVRTGSQVNKESFLAFSAKAMDLRRQNSRATAPNREAIRKSLLHRDRSRVGDPRELLRLLSFRLGSRELRPWSSDVEKKLCLGILDDDFVGALHSLLFLSISETEAPAICKRCDTRFRRTKTSQVFCSLSCGNAHRQKLWREKSREDSDVPKKAR
jgi:hypothetical protein